MSDRDSDLLNVRASRAVLNPAGVMQDEGVFQKFQLRSPTYDDCIRRKRSDLPGVEGLATESTRSLEQLRPAPWKISLNGSQFGPGIRLMYGPPSLSDRRLASVGQPMTCLILTWQSSSRIRRS